MLGCHHPPRTMFRADEFDPFGRTTEDGLAVVIPIAMVGASFVDPFSGGHHGTRSHAPCSSGATHVGVEADRLGTRLPAGSTSLPYYAIYPTTPSLKLA